MHLKCERLLQQSRKRKGDQPAHVERHGCSLMWLQLGSPGPNEVLWSSAAPSSVAYTPTAHILPPLHHSGSLRRCSQIPPGTLEEKTEKKDWHTGVWVRTTLQSPAATPDSQHTFSYSRLILDQSTAVTVASVWVKGGAAVASFTSKEFNVKKNLKKQTGTGVI